MNFKKFVTTVAGVGAVFLMGLDVYYLSSLFSGDSGAQIFQTVMWTSTPCALLCALTYFLHVTEKPAYKPVAVFSLVVNALYFLIRAFALGLQLVEVFNGTAETDSTEILALIEFAAYLVLLASNILFMLYFVTGRLKTAVQAVFSVAFLTLIADWGYIIFTAVQEFLNGGGSGIGNFFESNGALFQAGFFLSLGAALAYLFMVGSATKAFENKKK